jgi:hypothetical protein
LVVKYTNSYDTLFRGFKRLEKTLKEGRQGNIVKSQKWTSKGKNNTQDKITLQEITVQKKTVNLKTQTESLDTKTQQGNNSENRSKSWTDYGTILTAKTYV